MPDYITLTTDDGAAVYVHGDQVSIVTERPARTDDALASMIEAAEAKLRLAEAGFDMAPGDFCGCPSPDQLRKEIDTLKNERDSGVRGCTLRTGAEYYHLEVRESAEHVLALVAGA